MIYSAAREALETMGTEGDEPEDSEPSVKFEVVGSDVDAAWDLVQLSFEASCHLSLVVI